MNHLWRSIVGRDVLHAWNGDTTYCGIKQVRSMKRPQGSQEKQCDQCLAVITSRKKLQEARQQERKAGRENARQQRQRQAAAVIHALRPAKVDHAKWDRRVRQLIEMI